MLRFQGSHAHYRGLVGDHAEHAHLALQLVAPTKSAVVSSGGECLQVSADTALLIGSRVPHRLDGDGPVHLIFVDPAGSLGHRLRRLVGASTVPIRAGLAAEIAAAAIAPTNQAAFTPIEHAVKWLEVDPTLRLDDLARRLRIPPSTLRRRARSHLGCSLARWRLWTKLSRSCQALAHGSALADAASVGGFSDQAHFTRTMRCMFGVSPAQASEPLMAGQRRSPL